MNRNQRKQIAEQTLEIIERGGYDMDGQRVDLTASIREAVGRSRLLRPDDLEIMARKPRDRGRYETAIAVTNETTLNAARRLAGDTDPGVVLALNFASGKHPGGGFLRGSEAQEESLARASALYPTLNAHREYYTANRACPNEFYTDHMIYSPAVPVFRDDHADFLALPYTLSILTAPAVKAGEVRKHQPHLVDEIGETMRRRVGYVLHAAAEMGHVDLVLGAWGCGVFRNDPAEIAGLFAEQMLPGGPFAGVFRQVVFAVLDSSPQLAVNTAFADAFAEVRQ